MRSAEKSLGRRIVARPKLLAQFWLARFVFWRVWFFTIKPRHPTAMAPKAAAPKVSYIDLIKHAVAALADRVRAKRERENPGPAVVAWGTECRRLAPDIVACASRRVGSCRLTGRECRCRKVCRSAHTMWPLVAIV